MNPVTKDATRREIPRVCRRLRTKHAFDSDPEGALWKLGDATTESYWCLATMEAFGPDGSYCHPHVCGPARGCFRPADEDSDSVLQASASKDEPDKSV